ncbi:hypothetical protein BUALT_Bualt16G0083400 [Buddleja alternifolia]|uniref:Uncharacterized protein n=1 Tax=Buddleja alternifolia TaxID=168488 RepID=A0AAV6WIC1_9LAMI|nr:hypothetical protein BUALT_Bualt16G0083400 [Buddleja alternifolia]
MAVLKEMEREQGVSTKKVWDSVQLYTVRCANCSKWRLIPTKEKYEEIRESIVERPFLCEKAREWRPDISCADESDVKQDDSLHWAMDKPKIPQTPPGWQRIIRIRAEGGTKYADVYYVAPSNKRLRSMVELSRYHLSSIVKAWRSLNREIRISNASYFRYISEHHEGVSISQFSFQPPVPLDENYIAKRQARDPVASRDVTRATLDVNPISRDGPNKNTGLQCGGTESATKAVKALSEN